MIKMKNWHVCVPECDQSIGYDGENLVYRLQIETDSPPEWAYKLDLRYLDGQKNYLELIYTDGVLYVDILRDYLRPGSVKAQIRALNGEQEKHSNQFDLFVQLSINAPDAFEMTEPSAFAQLEQRLSSLKIASETAAQGAAASAQTAADAVVSATESANRAAESAEAAKKSEQEAAQIITDGQTAIRTEGDTQAERLQADADAHMEQLRETGAAALADIDKAVDTKLEQAEDAANAAKDAQDASEQMTQQMQGYLSDAEIARKGAQTAQANAEKAANEAGQRAAEEAVGSVREELSELVVQSETASGEAKQSANDASAILEQNQDILEQNQQIAVKTPYVGANGNWFTWNNTNGFYEDSGVKAQGERGNNGVALEADGIYAFNVDENGHLILSYTEDIPPDFSINKDGHLIYTF